MQYEVEQKFPLADPAQVDAALAKLGAVRHEPIEQTDTYFAHPVRDFARTDEALRIRLSAGKTLITYKGPKLDQATKTRREIELPLSESASVDQYGELLAALGFRPVAEVRKTRVPLSIDWKGSPVEGALDEIVGLGSFMELEIVIDEAGLEVAKATLAEVALELGLKKTERRSYLELLLD